MSKFIVGKSKHLSHQDNINVPLAKERSLAEKNLCQKTWNVPTELWMSNIKPVGLFPNAE